MSESFTVAVDPTNPGQFFACCGLLELADRLHPGAEGHFADGGRAFVVAGGGTLYDLLCTLVMDPPTELTRIEPSGLDVKPLLAPLAFSFDGGSTTALILDAWTQIAVVKGVVTVTANPPWNFWSGQQTSYGIWSGLRYELCRQLPTIARQGYRGLFTLRLFQKGRFGFDPGPAWNALDAGFSPNEQGIEVESSPAVELLAAVGLQRFRPIVSATRATFRYWTWGYSLPPCVASAAMSGAVSDPRSVCYRGSVVSRGQYAALGFSRPTSDGESDAQSE